MATENPGKTVKVFRDGYWEDRTFFIFHRAPQGPTKQATITIPENVVVAWEAAREAHQKAEELFTTWQREVHHDAPPRNPRGN